MDIKQDFTPEQYDRLDRIVNRVLDRMSLEAKHSIVDRDARLQSLHKDYESAVSKNNFFSQSIITRQMKARTDELLSTYAQKIIKEALETGDIIHFLDDDQRERFNSIRGRIFVTMQVLQNALADMTGLIHNNALNGHCRMLHQITDAREAIDKWSNDTVPVLKTACSDLALDECDRCYDYISNRVEVMNRKATRILLKSESK